MTVKISNFGDILMSRPAGREAFLMAKAYVFKEINNDEIILDFNDVKVLAPSWADEFITGIKLEYKNTLKYINTDNPSVKASLNTVLR
ncbi:MAG: STAS-like domain-containing protein [Treponema sp.]|nr:STAS-like domain-containing protein [Treponema sp.]